MLFFAEDCCLLQLLLCFLIIGLVVLFIMSMAYYFTAEKYPDLRHHDSEKYYLDAGDGNKKCLFPQLLSEKDGSLDLSLIVPAYKEEDRLPVMMDEAMGYLEDLGKTKKLSYEVIVVDDGSSDKTSEVALRYTRQYGSEKVRVLTLAQNRGKGGAVRMGMLRARGRHLLFADADGASHFPDYSKLQAAIDELVRTNPMAVVCGSRAHLEKESIVKRSFFRTVLMKGFHVLVLFVCNSGVRDTQCGFKLLTRPAARLIFSNLHVDRWAFDMDILYLARHFGMALGEVAVAWTEIDGTKMTPVLSWLQMGRDLLLIRFLYTTGAWKIRSAAQIDQLAKPKDD